MKAVSLLYHSFTLIFLSLIHHALALRFSAPSAGASYRGGGPIDITWEHEPVPDGQSQGAVPVGLFLCAGGNKDDYEVCFPCAGNFIHCKTLTYSHQQLTSLASRAELGESNSVTVTIDPAIGGNQPNA